MKHERSKIVVELPKVPLFSTNLDATGICQLSNGICIKIAKSSQQTFDVMNANGHTS